MNRAFTPWVALLGAVALAGCSGVSSRVEEKSAFFATLTPAVQADLRSGVIRAGYTPDMVYIALGQPSIVQDYDHDPTVPAAAATAGDKEPVTIWYYQVNIAGNATYDPTPGSEGWPELNGIPVDMGYLKTKTLVIFRAGGAIKVRRYR
jgi:hypothetical protein